MVPLGYSRNIHAPAASNAASATTPGPLRWLQPVTTIDSTADSKEAAASQITPFSAASLIPTAPPPSKPPSNVLS